MNTDKIEIQLSEYTIRRMYPWEGKKMLSLTQAQEMFNHAVKRFYLSSIMVILKNAFQVMISHEDGSTLRVSGPSDAVKKCFSFFIKEYAPTMGSVDGTEKNPAYFLITRNMNVTVSGETRKSSENTASVRDRERIGAKGSKNYRYNPNGLTIHGIDVKDTNGKTNTTWTIKDRTGKILTTCRVLNAEAWPFCESYIVKK